MVIIRRDLARGPEPYLGWYLEGEAGPPTEPTSYICYANEDKGEARFRIRVDASALSLDHLGKYTQAADVAFPACRGLIFLGTWQHGRDYGFTLPLQTTNIPTPQIRDALIRGLHRLYEAGFDKDDVELDYQGIAMALAVPTTLVERAAEHLQDIGLLTYAPETMVRNWSTGHIWLSATGVQYAESLPSIATMHTGANPRLTESEPIWDLFISHASEDKESVARPLKELLERNKLKAWLDENELTLGDSLRRKIEHGLANSSHGVVILSKSFFEKEWPQRELDGLTALEVQRGKVILPVWHEVDATYVARFSPTLADRKGVSTSNGLQHVVDEILRAIGR